MLKKKNRLTKKEYDTLFSRGSFYHSPVFMCKFILDTEEKKFSVVVPKKVLKSAVKRNRLRRLVYSIIEKRKDKIENINLIIIAKKPIVEMKDEEIEKEFFKILDKITM